MAKRDIKIPACKQGCRKWHRLDEAAALLSVDKRTIYRLIEAGRLPFRKDTQSRLIYHPHIDQFVRGEPFEQVEHETQETPKKGEKARKPHTQTHKQAPYNYQERGTAQIAAAAKAGPAAIGFIDQGFTERRKEKVSTSKPASKASIVTPRVLRAQSELIEALRESIQSAGLKRGQAEGKLSALMSEIWVAAEEVAARLPAA